MRVLVVGAHRTSGRSMHRYSQLLASAYRELGVELSVIHPPQVLSTHWRWSGVKWVGYVEKFIVFWPALWWAMRRAEVVHIADHSDAGWVLGVRRRRVVVTCHDLIAVRAALGELPEHRPGLTGRLYQWLVLRGLNQAGEVVSVSRCTAGDVERLAGRSSAVVHNPLDQRVASVKGGAFEESGSALAIPEGVQPVLPVGVEDYMLVVSTRDWRKNRVASVSAWARLRRTLEFADCALVVVGDEPDEEELAVARRAGARDALVVLSEVSDAELSLLYRGARVLIHLSRYEGFGWPILEAQAHRVPVLATDGPVFREVAGEHACLLTRAQLDDDSAEEWRRIAQNLLAIDLDAASLASHRFSWAGFVRALARDVLHHERENHWSGTALADHASDAVMRVQS